MTTSTQKIFAKSLKLMTLPQEGGNEVFALKSDNFASDAVFLTLIKGDIKSNRIARLLRNKNHRRTEYVQR